ncbi:hypothetical protein Tco_1218257, partial [Tanacetum coccineum]
MSNMKKKDSDSSSVSDNVKQKRGTSFLGLKRDASCIVLCFWGQNERKLEKLK